MFEGATAFNQPLEDWDVRKVRDTSQMFFASGFNQPLGKWKLDSWEEASLMFAMTDYDQDLSSWDLVGLKCYYRIFDGLHQFKRCFHFLPTERGQCLNGCRCEDFENHNIPEPWTGYKIFRADHPDREEDYYTEGRRFCEECGPEVNEWDSDEDEDDEEDDQSEEENDSGDEEDE